MRQTENDIQTQNDTFAESDMQIVGEPALQENKKWGISKNAIKMIAIITMFIDHFAAIIFESAMANTFDGECVKIGNLMLPYVSISIIDTLMRLIGRIAFPIFCYSLVEGFFYTKSKTKYLLRLAIFALLSEVPFNLAFRETMFTFEYQNVLVTMLIGLIVMIILQLIDSKLGKNAKNPGFEKSVATVILQAGIVLAGISIAEIMNTDYSGTGILAIVVMYYLRDKKNKMAMLTVALGTALLLVPQFQQTMETLMNSWNTLFSKFRIDSAYSSTIIVLFVLLPLCIAFVISLFGKAKNRDIAALGGGIATLTFLNTIECTAFFGLIAMGMYNGERGKKNVFMKYFFYIFYPTHILLLYLLGLALGVCQFSFF